MNNFGNYVLRTPEYTFAEVGDEFIISISIIQIFGNYILD